MAPLNVPSWSERPLDKTLIGLSLVAVTLLGLLEVFSGPQLATRVVLSICYNTSLALGVPSIYELPSSWRGWYSLEIGVEITTAITLGFLVWLLFALVYDAAGILVGLVPSSVTSIVTLTFRFHLHSYALLAVVPVVVAQAVLLARLLDKRWYEQEAERATRRYQKLASIRTSGLGGIEGGLVPTSTSAMITGRGGNGAIFRERNRVDDRSSRGHRRNDSDTEQGTSVGRRTPESELRISPGNSANFP